jgi:amino acid transporter
MRTIPEVIEETAPRPLKSALDILFGPPLADADDSEKIGPAAGIPVFGLDALSSAAYGPEAALTILLALGSVGIAYMMPIVLTIIVLLSVVYFSYRQTIAAYPGGGGSYTVASENLGTRVGLIAGAALLVDYILNVAVGISAGVGALVSAVPALYPYTLPLCLVILAILTGVNLRGVRESGLAFIVPTCVFVVSLGAVIVIGLIKTVLHDGHPIPIAAIPRCGPAMTAVSAWLLVKAFSSGCTAMTGVEAVSNGVPLFRDPTVKNARTTLTVIIAILILMLAGIAYLCRSYGIAATVPDQPGYESVLSQLAAAVSGRNVFYYVTMGTVLVALALSANTSFADFPRVCRAIAEKGYLPHSFTIRGRRLVFSIGICALSLFAGLLLVVFGGITDRLIPLFAVGAFTAFTLSQTGMVLHWKKNGGPGARRSILINGAGALATGLTTCVVIVAKFADGAWIAVLAIPGLVLLMSAIRHHYEGILREVDDSSPAKLSGIMPPIVVVPMKGWSKIAKKALRFAYTLSQNIFVVHFGPIRPSGTQAGSELEKKWDQYIINPAVDAGLLPPQLVVLQSRYRFVTTSIVKYILELEHNHPHRTIAVVLPELVERHWFNYLLHDQRTALLKVMLLIRGNGHIVVSGVPWYVQS